MRSIRSPAAPKLTSSADIEDEDEEDIRPFPKPLRMTSRRSPVARKLTSFADIKDEDEEDIQPATKRLRMRPPRDFTLPWLGNFPWNVEKWMLPNAVKSLELLKEHSTRGKDLVADGVRKRSDVSGRSCLAKALTGLSLQAVLHICLVQLEQLWKAGGTTTIDDCCVFTINPTGIGSSGSSNSTTHAYRIPVGQATRKPQDFHQPLSIDVIWQWNGY